MITIDIFDHRDIVRVDRGGDCAYNHTSPWAVVTCITQVTKQYSYGILHNPDGPAAEDEKGNPEYYLMGTKVDEDQFWRLRAQWELLEELDNGI